MQRRRRRRRRRGEWLSGFENELLKNSITVAQDAAGGQKGAKGGEDGPGSGNGGASSDWSGREEIASRLVIITPLTQLTSPPIALPIIFVIEPFGARDEIAFLSLAPSILRVRPPSVVTPLSRTIRHSALFEGSTSDRLEQTRLANLCSPSTSGDFVAHYGSAYVSTSWAFSYERSNMLRKTIHITY